MHLIRWMVGAGLGLLPLAGAALAACGTNEHVNTDGGGAAADAGSIGTAGRLCADASACGASAFCMLLSDNSMNAVGLCSSGCSASAECGDQGVCVPEPKAADGGPSPLGSPGACFRACSAPADCSGGIPCIWQAPLDAAVCQPLPTSFCHDIGGANACNQCLGAHCCAEVTACAEDIACAKGETSPAQTTVNASARALADCAGDGGAGASCAAPCSVDASGD
jgi:hypothetical protein